MIHHRTCTPTAARSIRPHCVRTAFARVFRTRQKVPFGGLRASTHDMYVGRSTTDAAALLEYSPMKIKPKTAVFTRRVHSGHRNICIFMDGHRRHRGQDQHVARPCVAQQRATCGSRLRRGCHQAARRPSGQSIEPSAIQDAGAGF